MVKLSLRESLRLDHELIGPEDLLLGLTDLREGGAIQILVALRTGPEAVRLALGDLMDEPAGQAIVHRLRDPAGIRGEIVDWVQIGPSAELRHLLEIAAARASDNGRSDIEVDDLVLCFTLRPGPAVTAGLWLTFDEALAATERDQAWTAPAERGDRWLVGPSDAARHQLMAAGGIALLRGTSIIEPSDLLLALLDDETNTDIFERIGVDRYRARNAIKREHALT